MLEASEVLADDSPSKALSASSSASRSLSVLAVSGSRCRTDWRLPTCCGEADGDGNGDGEAAGAAAAGKAAGGAAGAAAAGPVMVVWARSLGEGPCARSLLTAECSLLLTARAADNGTPRFSASRSRSKPTPSARAARPRLCTAPWQSKHARCTALTQPAWPPSTALGPSCRRSLRHARGAFASGIEECGPQLATVVATVHIRTLPAALMAVAPLLLLVFFFSRPHVSVRLR